MNPEIIPIVLILIIGFSINLNIEHYTNSRTSLTATSQPIKEKEHNSAISDDIDLKYRIINRDTNVVDDPLTAPERRVETSQYQKLKVNEYTRGSPDSYQLLGVLSNKEANKVYQLFGRRTYPGSYDWEYYVRGNDSDDFEFKYPIDTKNEIYDGSTMVLPISDHVFTVKIYDFDRPRYNPNI